MRRIIVFDVNETLLDVSALEPVFDRIVGDSAAVREWFSTLLLYSEVSTLAGPYADFAAIASAALDMTAGARGRSVTAEDRAEIVKGLQSLPPHPEVADALGRLRDAGLRMVTLTNSPPSTLEAQLDHAGLREFFEQTFSVDAVRRFKPAPEPYRQVAQALNAPCEDLRMVAAHAWDIVGAMRAGYAGAFVARPGKVLYPLGPRPDVVGADLGAVVDRIISVDAS